MDRSKDDADAVEKPPREKTPQPVEEADKIIQLRKELQNRFKQTRVDEVTAKEDERSNLSL